MLILNRRQQHSRSNIPYIDATLRHIQSHNHVFNARFLLGFMQTLTSLGEF